MALLALVAIIYTSLVITKLVLYSKLSDQLCPIDSNLKTYLILSGIAEILWPFLFVVVFVCCKDEDFATTITTYQNWIKHPGGVWQKNGTEKEKSRGKNHAALIF